MGKDHVRHDVVIIEHYQMGGEIWTFYVLLTSETLWISHLIIIEKKDSANVRSM